MAFHGSATHSSRHSTRHDCQADPVDSPRKFSQLSEQSSLRSPRAPDRSSPPPPPRKRESPGQQHNVRLQPQGQSLSAVTKLQHQKWLRRGHGHVGHAEATRTSRSSALSTQGVSRQKEARARRWAHAIWGTVSAVSKTISEDLNPKGQRERRLLKTQTPRALRPRGLEASIGRHRKVLLEARQTPGEGEAIGGPQEAARKVRKIIHSASKAENPLLKTAGRAEASGNARLREPREMADPSNRTIRVAAETRQLGTPSITQIMKNRAPRQKHPSRARDLAIRSARRA